MTVVATTFREAAEHHLRALVRWKKYWESIKRQAELSVQDLDDLIRDLDERIERMQAHLNGSQPFRDIETTVKIDNESDA